MNSKRATKSEAPTLPNTAPAAKKWHSAVTKFHSVTRSFCYFFFLWHVLVSFGLRKIGSFLHQASSFFGLLLRYNFWWFLFFFVGKNPSSLWQKLIPRGSPPWCLLSGLVKGSVKTSDFQPWGHTNVTGFSELRDPKKRQVLGYAQRSP